MMFFRHFCQRLQSIYSEGESKAVAFLVFQHLFGLSRTDVLMGRADDLTPEQRQALEPLALRLESGEPVQYVLGTTEFCGLTLHVAPGVLIPRPETEELVDWVSHEAEQHKGNTPLRILDIGTGSGCIALALAQRFPDADVTAWDISHEALSIARDNASRLGLQVHFQHHDALQEVDTDADTPKFDIIVSNPPYICYSEREDMATNVLDHEPHQALFVPDTDPLLFYRSISATALRQLNPGGALYFEINRRYGNDTVQMMQHMGFVDVQLRKDFMDNDRMVKGRVK